MQNLFADEVEFVKVTNFRKGVQAIVGNETIIPKMDEELPLSAKIKCDKMGFLEFEYKDTTYRIEKNSVILISEAIKSGGAKNVQLGKKTDVAGVRALEEEKKLKKSKKQKEADK